MSYLSSFIAIITFFELSTMAEGGPMNLHDTTTEFYRKLCEKEFDLKNLKIANDEQGIVADWLDSSKWSVFLGSGWKLTNMPTTSGNKVFSGHNRGAIMIGYALTVSREWIYRRGEETLSLQTLVSSTGNQAALECLIQRASNTSMAKIPFKKATGLGELYVVNRSGPEESRLWIYRNVCFYIDHYVEDDTKGHFDTFEFAKWVQEYAEKHLVKNISAYYPKVAQVEIQPSKIHVGDIVRVSLIMEDKSKSKDFMIEYEVNNLLDRQKQDALTVHAKALKAGAGEVKLLVIDRKTLLSTQKTVAINVLENE